MQWLLEGPAIEPLLQRVREEHGPDVRIVRAERVRVGGFVGFFAREQFEVTIEVDDAHAPPAGGRPAAAPQAGLRAAPQAALTSTRSDPSLTINGIDALLAAAERADGAEGLAPATHIGQVSHTGQVSAPGQTAPSPQALQGPGAFQGGVPVQQASFSSVLTGVQQGRVLPAETVVTVSAAQDPVLASSAGQGSAGQHSGGQGPVGQGPGVPSPAGPSPAVQRSAAPGPPPAAQVQAHAPQPAAPAAPSVTVLPETPLMAPLHLGPQRGAPVAGSAPTSWDPDWNPVVELTPFDPAPWEPPTETFPVEALAPLAPREPLSSSNPVPGLLPFEAQSQEARIQQAFAQAQALMDQARPPSRRAQGQRTDDQHSRTGSMLAVAPPSPALAPVVRSFAPVPGSEALAAIPSQRAAEAPPLSRREARLRGASRAPLPAREGEHLSERLAALGVPHRWLGDLPLSRAEALRHVADCIVATPTQARRQTTLATHPVVAVLADVDAAVPVARQLAVGLGLDEEEVVALHRKVPGLVRDRCLPGRSDLLAEVARARGRARALVVVLPAPVGAGPADRGALADTLTLLEADEVWAVVDATRRIEDTTTWLTGLTGQRGVDAVALTNVDATTAPAAALGLPAPVVLIGDQPATPKAWAGMLAARLAAQDLE